MTLAIFDFQIGSPYSEDERERADTNSANGRTTTRAAGQYGEWFMDKGRVVLPGTNAAPSDRRSYRDLVQFWRDHRGPVKRFKYKAVYPEHSQARDTFVATAGQTDFALTFRHVDSTDITVKRNDVVVSYTLADNDTENVRVTLDVAASLNDDVEITYGYYTPARFDQDTIPNDYIVRTGGGYDDETQTVADIRLIEASPGARYA